MFDGRVQAHDQAGKGWYARLFPVSFLFYGLIRFFDRRLSVRALMFDGSSILYSLLAISASEPSQVRVPVSMSWPMAMEENWVLSSKSVGQDTIESQGWSESDNSPRYQAVVSSTWTFPFYFIFSFMHRFWPCYLIIVILLSWLSF